MDRICHHPLHDGDLPDGVLWAGRPSRFAPPMPRPPKMNLRTGETVHDTRPVIDHTNYETWARQQLADHPDWAEGLDTATALACACPLDAEHCTADILVRILTDG